MAIIMPVLLWLLMAIVEYGIIFHIMSLSTYAANEAARLGKTGASYNLKGSREVMVKNKVEDILSPWLNKNTPVVVTMKSYGSFNDLGKSGSPGAGSSGEIVLYTVTLNWHPLTPMLASIIGKNGTVPISAHVLIKNEGF